MDKCIWNFEGNKIAKLSHQLTKRKSMAVFSFFSVLYYRAQQDKFEMRLIPTYG